MVVHNGSPLSSTFCAYVSFTMDPPCHPLVISFRADLTMNIYYECRGDMHGDEDGGEGRV